MRRQRGTNETRLFINEQRKWIILMMVGGVIGTLMALLRRDYEPIFFSLYHFLNDQIDRTNTMAIIKDSIITYGSQMLILWGCGMFQITRYLGMILFIMFSAMYSFTASSVLLLYGLKGILIVLGMAGLQMVVMLFMFICIAQSGTIGCAKVYRKYYCILLGQCSIVIVILGLMNAYIQPVIENIMKKLI